jgi:phosphatidylinositol-3,4,5-trisphosphate 3-phosphatase and dual-specificity protein phosphatase PTEN
MMTNKEKMFSIWINTAFFEPSGVMVIDKFMLDKACKDKSNKRFKNEFHIEIHAKILS